MRLPLALSTFTLVNKPSMLIAVVDDEEPIRRALGRLLRSAGLLVETFTTGHEFLQSLHHHRPSCVILDLHMPSINGFEVQAAMHEARTHIPTIIITGHDSADSRDRAIQGGASEFLRKPVDDKHLLIAIEKAVAAAEKQT